MRSLLACVFLTLASCSEDMLGPPNDTVYVFGVGGEPLDLEASGPVIRRQDGLLILAFECDNTECVAPDGLVQTENDKRAYPSTTLVRAAGDG